MHIRCKDCIFVEYTSSSLLTMHLLLQKYAYLLQRLHILYKDCAFVTKTSFSIRRLHIRCKNCIRTTNTSFLLQIQHSRCKKYIFVAKDTLHCKTMLFSLENGSKKNISSLQNASYLSISPSCPSLTDALHFQIAT